jgi:hypothetical protein
MTASATWIATHRVPRQGMDAWTEPDPALPPSADLEPRIAMQLVGTAGVWAQVRGENGWVGWVDGRLLEQVDGDNVGDRRAFVLLAVAIAVLIVLAFVAFTT